MYNEEYETENDKDAKASDNFLVNFYYNNKVLIWILIGVFAFIIIISLLTKGGSSSSSSSGYKVTILPDTDVTIAIGHSTTLKASVENDANASTSIIWTSENENIAKVSDGTVTAVNYGKTKIYATYIRNGNDKYTSDPKEITVADGDPTLTLSDVSFRNGELYMPVNSTYPISLSMVPSDGYITNKTFTSSNESVVVVDNNGLVTSVGEGEATISLIVNDGVFRKTLKVFVSRDYTISEIIVTPESINLEGELRTMKVSTKEKLQYSVFPTDSDTSKLIWTSSDETVVTVDKSGIVEALKSGRATITVKSLTGVSDSIDIEVGENVVEVTDISLSSTNLYLTVGQNETITPVVSPADASNKSLSFLSGDSTIITVAPNQTGTSATIYALNAGTTTLTISSSNIEKRVSVTVTGGSTTQPTTPSTPSTPSPVSTQGFQVESRDANWETTHEGFIVTSYNSTINNEATAPVQIIVTKTNSSLSKIRLAICPYTSSSTPSCDPDASSGVREIIDSDSGISINSAGTYLLRFATYNSNGNRVGLYDKYIAVKGSGGSDTSGGTNPVITVSTSRLSISSTTGSGTVKAKVDKLGKFDLSISPSSCAEFSQGGRATVSTTVSAVNRDYSIDIRGKGSACTATLTIKFIPNDTANYNTVTKTVQIAVGSTARKDIGSFPDSAFTCNTSTGALIIRDGSTTLGSSDYSCTKTTSGTKYKYVCTGSGSYTGTTTRYCNIPVTKKDISSFPNSAFTCNRSTGALTIKDGSTTLGSSDYSCTKTTESTKYKYVCTGKGNYTGTVTLRCSIPTVTAKDMSTLSHRCVGATLHLYDGTTELSVSQYCTSVFVGRGSIYGIYRYTCTPHGDSRYTGSKTITCGS